MVRRDDEVCEYSDLPHDQCDHCVNPGAIHATDTVAKGEEAFFARYDGICARGCGAPIVGGDDRIKRSPDGYVHEEC